MSPLSEREQRILQEIEKGLYDGDPNFAREVRRRWWQTGDLRGAKLGALLFAVGIALLIGFFVTSRVVIGVLAFGAMVAGIVLAAGSVRAFATTHREVHGSPRARAGRRLEDWERRLRERYRRR